MSVNLRHFETAPFYVTSGRYISVSILAQSGETRLLLKVLAQNEY